jgi:DNA-binding NarL/FixJ family response regulator
MFVHSLEKIKKLYEELNNENDVARELGVSRQFMYEYRIKNNIQYDKNTARNKTHFFKYDLRNSKIINMYKDGKKIDDICKKFNMNESNVRFILKKGK